VVPGQPCGATALGRRAHTNQPGSDSAEPFFPLETVTSQTRWLAALHRSGAGRCDPRAEQDLEALWTRAHVAGTADGERDQGERHRVLTPLTSILVLETVPTTRAGEFPARNPRGASRAGRAGRASRSEHYAFQVHLWPDTALGVDPDSHLAD